MYRYRRFSWSCATRRTRLLFLPTVVPSTGALPVQPSSPGRECATPSRMHARRRPRPTPTPPSAESHPHQNWPSKPSRSWRARAARWSLAVTVKTSARRACTTRRDDR